MINLEEVAQAIEKDFSEGQETLKKYLEQGPDNENSYITNGEIRRPLILIACEQGNFRAVELLLMYGASPNDRIVGGHLVGLTPLHAIALQPELNYYIDIIKLLVKNQADVNAIYKKKITVLDYIIESCTNIEIDNENKFSELVLNAAKILCEAGFDPRIKISDQTPREQITVYLKFPIIADLNKKVLLKLGQYLEEQEKIKDAQEKSENTSASGDKKNLKESLESNGFKRRGSKP